MSDPHDEFWVCPDCGGLEFHQKQYSVVNASEICIIDHHGVTIDYDDYETHDSEVTDYDDATCASCDAQPEIFKSESEWLNFRAEHTNKKGEWSSEVLDKKQRDPEFIARYMAGKV